MKNITKEQIEQTWKEVFPNSLMSVITAPLSQDGLSCSGRLGKDKSEWANGIAENDPLTYQFMIEDGNYIEYRTLLYIKPDNIYNVYKSVWLRKKSIKDISIDKLKNRFEQVKAFVVENRGNFINLNFDINDKI